MRQWEGGEIPDKKDDHERVLGSSRMNGNAGRRADWSSELAGDVFMFGFRLLRMTLAAQEHSEVEREREGGGGGGGGGGLAISAGDGCKENTLAAQEHSEVEKERKKEGERERKRGVGALAIVQ